MASAGQNYAAADVTSPRSVAAYVLPPLFLAPNYYFQNWASLGLQAPAPGYVWVRFGPDLLLINQNTNEVEDVVYGAFM